MKLIPLLVTISAAIVAIVVCVLLYFRLRTKAEKTGKPKADPKKPDSKPTPPGVKSAQPQAGPFSSQTDSTPSEKPLDELAAKPLGGTRSSLAPAEPLSGTFSNEIPTVEPLAGNPLIPTERTHVEPLLIPTATTPVEPLSIPTTRTHVEPLADQFSKEMTPVKPLAGNRPSSTGSMSADHGDSKRLSARGSRQSRGHSVSTKESTTDADQEGSRESMDDVNLNLEYLAWCSVLTDRYRNEMEFMSATRLFTDDLYEETLTLTGMDIIRTNWAKIEKTKDNAHAITPLIEVYEKFFEISGSNLSKIPGNLYVRLLFLYRILDWDENSQISKDLGFCALIFPKMDQKLKEIQNDMNEVEKQIMQEKVQAIENDEAMVFLDTNHQYSLYKDTLVTDDEKMRRLWIKYAATTQLFDNVYGKLKTQETNEDRLPRKVTNSMEYEIKHCREIIEGTTAFINHVDPHYFILAFVDLGRYLCKSSIQEFQVSTAELTTWMKHLRGHGTGSTTDSNARYYTLVVSPFWTIWKNAHEHKQNFETNLSTDMKTYSESVKAWCNLNPC